MTNVQQTDTKLNPIARNGIALGGVGLDVKINKQEVHLALDTGATGVLLGRAAAEKLGLQRLGHAADHRDGRCRHAGRLHRGCRPGSHWRSGIPGLRGEGHGPGNASTGQDGLIGADVFSSYLIDIDIPSAKLRLSPLPQRPNEAAQPAALQTMTQDSDESGGEATPAGKNGSTPTDLPKDAYIAPSMTSWTKVYRFRSLLLVPTLVDRTGPMLFLIDTGSFSNVLSTRAAKQVTQIESDPNMQIRGMSGSVSKVYRADKATCNLADMNSRTRTSLHLTFLP